MYAQSSGYLCLFSVNSRECDVNIKVYLSGHIDLLTYLSTYLSTYSYYQSIYLSTLILNYLVLVY